MLTDDDLTGQLKLAFDEVTQDIVPAAGLAAAVRRRHRAARRRSTAVKIAIPAAAAAWAGGVVIAGGGADHSKQPPATAHSAPGAPQTSSANPQIKTVAYELKVAAEPGDAFSCLDPNILRLADNPGTWLMLGGSHCTLMVVDTDASLPADAQPIDFVGVPGLYGTTDERAGTRTIYSRNPEGGWSALTVAADTPEQALREFYTPTG
jgi:hypothetical protein